jgi:hypothetical protein
MRKIATFQDLGQAHNYLGILDTPTNPRHFFSELLIRICSNKSDLANILGIQRTLLYQKKLPLKKGTKLRSRIMHLVIATDMVYELLRNDKSKTLAWLIAPNTFLFGDSPFEVIMRDEGEAIISWLMEKLGKKPGAAF